MFFLTYSSVGKAVVAALRNPEASFNRALKVQSFVVTPKQILVEFEKQTGGQAWAVCSYSLHEVKAAEERAWSEGSAYAVDYTLRRIWAEGGTLYDEVDNERIGLDGARLETLETAVRRALTTSW